VEIAHRAYAMTTDAQCSDCAAELSAALGAELHVRKWRTLWRFSQLFPGISAFFRRALQRAA